MVSITIRDVPEDARSELAARAARSGRSMQEFLRAHLVDLASRPDQAELLDRLAQEKHRDGTRLSIQQILAATDADRR